MELDGEYIGWDFTEQNLDDYVLSGDFTGADFTGASLAGADLRKGTFNDADFTNTNLEDARLSLFFNFHVRSLEGTIMPNGKLHQ
jgi:uncharacterized protein YjbI with pentapeptide repeats